MLVRLLDDGIHPVFDDLFSSLSIVISLELVGAQAVGRSIQN